MAPHDADTKRILPVSLELSISIPKPSFGTSTDSPFHAHG